MFLQSTSSLMSIARQCLAIQARRNIVVSSVAFQKLDPIQQLFAQKVKEYGNKSKSQGGGLVDASTESKQALDDQLNKLKKQFGAEGQDMTSFPTFNFADPDLEAVGLNLDPETVAKAEDAARQAAQEATPQEEEDPTKPYFVL